MSIFDGLLRRRSVRYRLILRDARALKGLFESRGHERLGYSCLGDLAEDLGYSADEGRRLYAVARVLQWMPDIERLLFSGRMNIEKAAALARLFDTPGAIHEGDTWLHWAERSTTADFQRRVNRRVEETLRGEPVEKVSFWVTENGAEQFRRCRAILSRRAERRMTRGETLESLTTYFLTREDPLSVKPGRRRVPDTGNLDRRGPAADGRTSPADGRASDADGRASDADGRASDHRRPSCTREGSAGGGRQRSGARSGVDLRPGGDLRTRDDLRPSDVASADPDVHGTDSRSPAARDGPRYGPSRYIPAEVKRAVRIRAGDRCEFARCSFDTWLDFAHIVPHSAGGSREQDNLLLLCGNHHRAFDSGQMRVRVIQGRVVFIDPWERYFPGPRTRSEPSMSSPSSTRVRPASTRLRPASTRLVKEESTGPPPETG